VSGTFAAITCCVDIPDYPFQITMVDWSQEYCINKVAIGGEPEEEKEYQVRAAVTSYPKWAISAPLPCQIITQYYHWGHKAVDFGKCKTNKGVFSVDAGTVIFAGWKGNYGFRVEMEHSNGYISTYSHLEKMYVKKGDIINQHTLLGILGTTGYSSGPHLHWEIIYDGVKLNPLNYL